MEIITKEPISRISRISRIKKYHTYDAECECTRCGVKGLFLDLSHSFGFKLGSGFRSTFDRIYDRLCKTDARVVRKRFENLLLMTSEDWNKKYPQFGGSPCLSDWIYLLTGERPLTEEQQIIKRKKDEENINHKVGFIIMKINDKNFSHAFADFYWKDDNSHYKDLINKYLGLNPSERPKNKKERDARALWIVNILRDKFLKDPIKTKKDLRNIESKSQQLLLT